MRARYSATVLMADPCAQARLGSSTARSRREVAVLGWGNDVYCGRSYRLASARRPRGVSAKCTSINPSASNSAAKSHGGGLPSST